MSRAQSRAGRQAGLMEEGQRMYDPLEEGYDAHPQASFGELAAKAGQSRRELMGKALGQWVNGRDTGAQVELPRCKQCGEKMKFEGYREWSIHGLEGDSRLVRAYYVCPHCQGETLFSPGRQAKPAKRSLEGRGCTSRGATRAVREIL